MRRLVGVVIALECDMVNHLSAVITASELTQLRAFHAFGQGIEMS